MSSKEERGGGGETQNSQRKKREATPACESDLEFRQLSAEQHSAEDGDTVATDLGAEKKSRLSDHEPISIIDPRGEAVMFENVDPDAEIHVIYQKVDGTWACKKDDDLTQWYGTLTPAEYHENGLVSFKVCGTESGQEESNKWPFVGTKFSRVFTETRAGCPPIRCLRGSNGDGVTFVLIKSNGSAEAARKVKNVNEIGPQIAEFIQTHFYHNRA